MIKIAICDDDNIELSKTRRLIEEYKNTHSKYQFQCYEFTKIQVFFDHISENGCFDILFLDVYMPEMLGTDVARKLRENGDKSEIIFTTTSKDHAIDAFKVDALHYIVKPFEKDELFLVLDKALSKLSKKSEKYVMLKTRTIVRKVPVSEIIYSESYKHNQNIKTIDGKIITVRMTVDELFNLFSENGEFIKNGSSYIVNLQHIREISAKHILTDILDILPVPRGNYTMLKEAYMEYIFSGGDK